MMARISALLVAAAVAGCVGDNTQSLVILQNNVPTASGGVCLAPAGATSTFRAAGTLDLSFWAGTDTPRAGYLMFPVVENNLSGTVAGTAISQSTDQFAIEINRIDVKVVDADSGATVGQPFSVPAFKVLESGGTAGFAVDVLPPSIIPALAADRYVMVKLRVVGNRDGGEIKSNEMDYAIYVCDGCLAYDAGACVDYSGEATGNECNIAQDDPVACCLQSSGSYICPAAAETPAEG
jgi:hypothetical protein